MKPQEVDECLLYEASEESRLCNSYIMLASLKNTRSQSAWDSRRDTLFTSPRDSEISRQKFTKNAKKANSIYPKNKEEAQLRRNHLLEARAALYAMVSKIELACEMFGIEEKKLKYWMSMVNEESRLISGVLTSDAQRFKDLP